MLTDNTMTNFSTTQTQTTTTMNDLTFDGMPQSLASLHDKCDTIIALLSTIANCTANGGRHVPISMSEACKLLGKSPSTIYDMTSKRKIPFHKRGNKLYFFEDELFQWVKDGGCGDVTYPDNGNGNVDDTKAEHHLKTLQSNVKRKPKSSLTEQ